MSFDPADPVGSVCADIVGKRAWLVRKGYSSFLTLEFGEPHLRVREPIADAASPALRRPRVSVRGDWHFWVHSCNWTVAEGDAELAHSKSADGEIEAAARSIDGQRLLAMEVDSGSLESRLTFELGTVLRLGAYDAQSECWLLYALGGMVLSLRGDGRYSWSPGDQAPHAQVWVPLPG